MTGTDKKRKKLSGFTLVELLVTIGVMGVLLSIGGLSLTGIRNNDRLDLLASEVRSSLLEVQSRSGNNVVSGVYFETGRFVYFEGAAYLEGEPENLETVLPSGITFSSIQLPSNTAFFDPVTRELVGFTDPSRVVISDSSGASRTISINRWGVIDVQ